MQEIFLKLWIKRSLVANVENPEGYLYRTAANQVLDYFKRLASKNKMLGRQQLPDSEDKGNSGTAILQTKEIETIVAKAVDQLPAQRQLIYRFREEGLSYSEIAQKLEISTNTVKNQLIDASRSVRDYLIQRGISPILFIQSCLLLEKIFIR